MEIELHAAEPAPMGVAGPGVSAAVPSMVERKGIQYHPEHQITRVESGSAWFADGASIPFGLLIYMPPIRPPNVLAGSGLAQASGWLEVDRRTLQTRFQGVYGLGDVTMIPLAMGKPLPKAGVFAHAQREVVARDIARVGVPVGGGRSGHGCGLPWAVRGWES